MSDTKKILRIYKHGSSHWVGDGFPVRNFIPSSGISHEIDPFLMLDYAGPKYFESASKARGVGEHPHRGFETVTIAYQGSVEHRDSAGNSGVIHPGDVQWMTAGSGLVHEEMHEQDFARRGGTFEMIQLWVNLPRAHKMTAPRYQTLAKEQIPVLDLGGGSFARLIAGKLTGVVGPAQTFTPLTLMDISLEPGSSELSLPAGHSCAVFLLSGELEIEGREFGGASLALLESEAEKLRLKAPGKSRLLIMGGQPIVEPVASYGPFVMNTQEELLQAVDDYRSGRMGSLSLS